MAKTDRWGGSWLTSWLLSWTKEDTVIVPAHNHLRMYADDKHLRMDANSNHLRMRK